MDLIEDDMGDPLEAAEILVQDIAEDLRGHDGHIGQGIDHDVPGDDADAVRTIERLEFLELLVGEGFDGRGIDDPVAVEDGPVDQVIGDQRLADPGRARTPGPNGPR